MVAVHHPLPCLLAIPLLPFHSGSLYGTLWYKHAQLPLNGTAIARTGANKAYIKNQKSVFQIEAKLEIGIEETRFSRTPPCTFRSTQSPGGPVSPTRSMRGVRKAAPVRFSLQNIGVHRLRVCRLCNGGGVLFGAGKTVSGHSSKVTGQEGRPRHKEVQRAQGCACIHEPAS